MHDKNHLLTGIEDILTQYGFTEHKFADMHRYSSLVPSMTNKRIDYWNGMQMANMFLVAMDLAAELLSIATRVKELLYAERHRQGGQAYLIRAPQYLQETGGKATDSARVHYKDLDDQYQNCRIREAAASGLIEYLKAKKYQFEEAHRLCKLMYKEDKPINGSGVHGG